MQDARVACGTAVLTNEIMKMVIEISTYWMCGTCKHLFQEHFARVYASWLDGGATICPHRDGIPKLCPVSDLGQ